MDQAVESLILSQITSDISISYKEDGTFVNYTCDTKLTLQQFNKNNDAIIQKCIEKITQLFADNQSRGRIESQILETLRTVSTDNDRDDPKQIVTTLLLGMDAKSSNDFENVSIKMRNYSRNAAVSIRFSY